MRKTLLVVVALLAVGCGGPSAEYTRQADALLAKMETGASIRDEALGDGADEMALAEKYLKETESVPTDAGDFESAWDAKDEGKLESFKLIMDSAHEVLEARSAMRRGIDEPETLGAAFSSNGSGTVIQKARRFLQEGK